MGGSRRSRQGVSSRGVGPDDWGDHYDENGEKLLSETALAPRQLRITLAYYWDFRDEIDEAVAANRRTIDEIESEYPFLEIVTRAD